MYNRQTVMHWKDRVRPEMFALRNVLQILTNMSKLGCCCAPIFLVFFALWTGVSGSLLYTRKGPGESKLSSLCFFAVAFVPLFGSAQCKLHFKELSFSPGDLFFFFFF